MNATNDSEAQPPLGETAETQNFNRREIVSGGKSCDGQSPKRGCLATFALIILIVGGLSILAIVVMGTFSANLVDAMGKISEKVGQESRELRENVLVVGNTERRIAVIPLVEPIAGWGNYQIGDGAAHHLAKQLRAAADDESVRTVLLEVNSPGGELTASDMLHNEILQLQKAGKKVVAAVDSLAASGGYYVIASADYIFAQPTGMVGSFGVISQHFEIAQLLEKIGVKVEPLKSVASKDIGSIFREMTAAEREIFTKILDTYHRRFIDIIAQGRGIAAEKVAELATGEIFTAEDAVAKKLIDKIGYYDDALALAQELTGGNAEVFTYDKSFDWRAALAAFGMQNSPAHWLENFAAAANRKIYLR